MVKPFFNCNIDIREGADMIVCMNRGSISKRERERCDTGKQKNDVRQIRYGTQTLDAIPSTRTVGHAEPRHWNKTPH